MNPPPGFAAHPGFVGPGAVPFVPGLILILRGPGPRGSPRPISSGRGDRSRSIVRS